MPPRAGLRESATTEEIRTELARDSALLVLFLPGALPNTPPAAAVWKTVERRLAEGVVRLDEALWFLALQDWLYGDNDSAIARAHEALASHRQAGSPSTADTMRPDVWLLTRLHLLLASD